MDGATDNTGETQSQHNADLVWDHTGDVDSDPLLGHTTLQSSTVESRPCSLQLSYDQAQDLLKVLDNTRYVLESYVQQAHIPAQDQGGGAGRRGHSWWAYHCFPARRRIVARYIFLITLILQAINLLAVSIIDVWPRNDDGTVVIAAGIIMIFLQCLNLIFVIMVSGRLVKQLYKHKVSVLLLAQSYVATLLLFAGIYTLTYRMEPSSWKFIQESLDQDPILVIVLYSKFLFFSVSTATLCGSDNVLPKGWYTCLFAALQMLMSFVYFASILGQTLSQNTQYWLGVGGSEPPSSPHPSGRSRQPSVRSSSVQRVQVSNQASGAHNHSWPPVPPTGSGRRGEGDEGERGTQGVLVDIDPGPYSINASSPDHSLT